MDEEDLAIRNSTYRSFVELGRAPSATDIAAVVGRSSEDVVASWRRLHAAHALVLDDDRRSVRMANPFSAVETPHRVQAAGRDWFANCAWDAFGICAALDVDGDVRTTCPDCAEPVEVSVRSRRPEDTSLLFHCLVPASRWWDDIGFT